MKPFASLKTICLRFLFKPIHKTEDCLRCFTLLSRGRINKWVTKRDLKKKGHIIFEETKRSKRAWQLIVSTRTYKGAIIHAR